MKSIELDYTKRCGDEPTKGHNRWHPDIPPAVEVEPGEEVVLQTRNAFDGGITPQSKAGDLRNVNLNLVHPLTGPVYVRGAQPSDLLEVNTLNIEPRPLGVHLHHPRLRVPSGPVPGPLHCPLGHRRRLRPVCTASRRADTRGTLHGHHRDRSLPPASPADTPSGGGAAAAWRLRTGPGAAGRRARHRAPRLRGVAHDPAPASTGATWISSSSRRGHGCSCPFTPRGPFSPRETAHFAQGDSECCGTAVEMDCTLHVSFQVRKGEATRRNLRFPIFERDDYFTSPEMAAPKRFVATTGMCIAEDGTNESENATLAARHALLNMIQLLMERGWSREQAYCICSVAVDLKISEMVDVPNFVVSAFLPLDIFQG